MIPKGYQLVPIEPTEAMLKAANMAAVTAIEWDELFYVEKTVYRAMLAAAPQPPVAQPLSEGQLFALLMLCSDIPPLRIPPGWIDFARVIERAHGIGANCRHCGGEMRQSTALDDVMTGSPDFPGDTGNEHGCTLNPSGKANMVDCMKCTKCGWSVT
jgi:hypothetical protein